MRKEPALVQLNKDIPAENSNTIRLVNSGLPEEFGIMSGNQNRAGFFIKDAQQVPALFADGSCAMAAFNVQRIMPAVAGNLQKAAEVGVGTDVK